MTLIKSILIVLALSIPFAFSQQFSPLQKTTFQQRPITREEMLNYVKEGISQEEILKHFGVPMDRYPSRDQVTIISYFYFPPPEKPIAVDGRIPSGIRLFFTDSKLTKWEESYCYIIRNNKNKEAEQGAAANP